MYINVISMKTSIHQILVSIKAREPETIAAIFVRITMLNERFVHHPYECLLWNAALC